MTIKAEDKRYSNATTITSSEADLDDDGYFASVVTVQHCQKSNKGAQDLEWKKVTWPSESDTQPHLQSNKEGHETHHKVLHSNDFITKEQSKKGLELEEKPFGWIHQVAESSHHLVGDAEMELQKRAFDVKHANDRSRSRTRSNFITNRARSFERAHASRNTEDHPQPLRRRSPSLRRNDEVWISRPESHNGEEEQMKARHRWNSVGRLNTSAWEHRIRCESPAPPPPPMERHLRRRRLTGEEMTPPPPPPRSGSFSKKKEDHHPTHKQEGSQISGSLKDAKVSEWIRKSQDCLIQNEQNHQSYFETHESSTQSSQTTHHEVHSHESEAIRFRQEQLKQMEEEKQRQEADIRRQGEELRRKELEMKKKELEMLRKKEEVKKLEEMNRLQVQREEEEARLKKEYEITRQKRLAEEHEKKQNELMERKRQEEIRKQEEYERQRKYEEQLKQKHMEEERQKEQQLLYEKRIQMDKEERARLHSLQMEQRQERLRKQQEQEENNKRLELLRLEEELRCQEEMRRIGEENERERRRHEEDKRSQLLEMKKMEEKNVSYMESQHHHKQSQEPQRHRSRHRSREAHFHPTDTKEVHRPVTPIGARTGHVNSTAHFFNERSKSMDRKDDYEPRRHHRGHILKDWVRNTQSEEQDPPSRPGSSLGQTLGAVKHTIENWNHSALHQQTQAELPVSRARSLSQHRDWKPCVRDRPVTPTRFDTVDTHQVQDTIKDWGPHKQESGRNSPLPSRMIAETFADSKVGSQEWKLNEIYNNQKETFYMDEDAPWRPKPTPQPNLKLLNISVTRNVVKEKPKSKGEIIPPPPLPEQHVNKCHKVQNRNLFITELPDLPLHEESTGSRYESTKQVMTSTTNSSQVHFEGKQNTSDIVKDKNYIPEPVVSDSWFTGAQSSKPKSSSHNVLSTTSSASTIAHLEGLKSPTQTGKTPLPVLAGWYDSDSKKYPPPIKDQDMHKEIPKAPQLPSAPKEVNPLASPDADPPTIQKYENDVDKRQRELEELRNLRSARNKRLQDAFEIRDPYLDYEESVESYSDDYTDDETVEEGIPKEPSRPAPTRRIGNLFNRSSDEWNEERAPCPPKRNSSKEFMKGIKP